MSFILSFYIRIKVTLKAQRDSKEPTLQHVVNEKIRFEKLQVISSEGENLGVISRSEALRLAQNDNLDLVLLAEKGKEDYPVAKIMDYGKVAYEKKKQLMKAKKKQVVIQIKEIRLSPKIGEHDFKTKMNQAIGFLNEGKHLKVSLIFKGREIATKEERGRELLDKIESYFHQAGLAKLGHDKESKIGKFWSRTYYLKK